MSKSQYDALKERKAAAKKQLEKEYASFIKIVNEISKTSHGMRWLKFCYRESGFGEVSRDINPSLLQRNEALRYLYVKCFRQFFNQETLKNVETNIITTEDENV